MGLLVDGQDVAEFFVCLGDPFPLFWGWKCFLVFVWSFFCLGLFFKCFFGSFFGLFRCFFVGFACFLFGFCLF